MAAQLNFKEEKCGLALLHIVNGQTCKNNVGKIQFSGGSAWTTNLDPFVYGGIRI